jgi:hypothetical protein
MGFVELFARGRGGLCFLICKNSNVITNLIDQTQVPHFHKENQDSHITMETLAVTMVTVG